MPEKMIEPLDLFCTRIKSSYNFWFINLKGFDDEYVKNRFILLNFLQLYILWILQLKGLLNNDINYLKNKFNEIIGKEDQSFQYFLIHLIKIISLKIKNSSENDYFVGKVIQIKGISLFDDLPPLPCINVPNNYYYSSETSNSQNLDFFPVLNALESLNSIDSIEFPSIFGSLYENFLFFSTKRKSGVYYTPKELCQYLSRYTIEKWLINELKKNMIISSNDIFTIINNFTTVSDLRNFFTILQRLKILDPTAGAGNFLEASLNFLIELYLSLRKKIEVLGSTKDPVIFYDVLDENGDLHQIILDELTSLNYFQFEIITKLICMNNLYGVELDPIAVKVIKSRFFLSAINSFERDFDFCDLNFDRTFDNIKEGNSILGLVSIYSIFKKCNQITEDKQLFTLEEKIQISTSLQDYLFRATNAIQNYISRDICYFIQRLESNDGVIYLTKFEEYYTFLNVLKKIQFLNSKNLISEELDTLLEYIIQKLSNLLNYLYNKTNFIPDSYLSQLFHWPLEFPLALNLLKGFSVILCNPPYKGESGNKEFFRVLSRVFPNYYESKMDLWYLFVHRAIDLLQEKGYMTFLTSNYWITASGGKTLRERIFRETEIDKYINFGGNSIFNSAPGIHVNSFTLKKTQEEGIPIKCTQFTKKYPLGTNLIKKLKHQKNYEILKNQIRFGDFTPYFHFIPPNVSELVKRIISSSKQLYLSGFKVREGIITGMNKISKIQIKKFKINEKYLNSGVFILDLNQPRDKSILITLLPQETKFVKYFYKSSDISRFFSSILTSKMILYLDKKISDIAFLPNIRDHLIPFEFLLKSSLDNFPYLNRPRIIEIFLSPKIVTPQRKKINSFAYNSYPWFAAQDVYFISSNNFSDDSRLLKGLLLILNSDLAFFWFNWMGKKKGNQLEFFGEPLEFFPVHKDFLKYNILLAQLSEYMIFLTEEGPSLELGISIRTFFNEKIINALINELYQIKEKKKTSILHERLGLIVKPIQFDEWENIHYLLKIGKDIDIRKYTQIRSINYSIILEVYNQVLSNFQIQSLLNDYFFEYPII